MAKEEKPVTAKELQDKLTPKERKFCEEYLIDLNATQAAIRAGYKSSSMAAVGQMGYTLLKKREIRAYIDFRRAEHSRRTGVTVDRIIRELARVAFVDPTNLVDMETAGVLEFATEDDRAAIASVKVKTIPGPDGAMGIEREVRFSDKLKALEQLGKHFGMFQTNVTLTGAVPVKIIDDIVRQPEEEEATEGVEDE